jgi:hypothetical protein
VLTRDGVHHAVGRDPLQMEKNKVGNFLQLIREYNNISEQCELDPGNNLLKLELAAKSLELQISKNSLVEISVFENLHLTTSGDVFLEVLLSNVKGNAISFQQWVKKTEHTLKSRLVNKLNKLKIDFPNNMTPYTIQKMSS